MYLKDPSFDWDEENKTARCSINVGSEEFPQLLVGTAVCAPEDYDMCNEKTGCDIAYHRVIIKLLKWYKQYDIKPRLEALKKLYYSMKMSNQFNPKSYENKMLQRQIRQIQNELDVTNDFLAERKQILNSYLQEKETFYQKIRSFRRVQEEEIKHKAEN